MYSVYQLSQDEQKRLLELFPPRYAKIYADHVTVQFGGNRVVVPLPPPANKMEIIGRADDNHGLEALIVRIDDHLKRSDGKVYHITWSLDPNIVPDPDITTTDNQYRPVHSNMLIGNLIDTSGTLLPTRNTRWSFSRYTTSIPFYAEPKTKYTALELSHQHGHTI
ncbi:MAG: hypothetical protein SPL08_01170 [Pseudomonadota bacterium]|nr:hypothetical protein [Pseudomonadota bacterium]